MALRLSASRARGLVRLSMALATRSADAAETTSAGFLQCRPWQNHTSTTSRQYSTVEEAQSQIDEVNDMFAEARDIIEDARDEAETVYFNEAHGEAKEAVTGCLDKYSAIIDSLSAEQKGKLQRSMGLKIEQLKAELEELDHLHA